jgi:hypothetical protein
VNGSHTIFLATASSFVPDTSKKGYDGYYILASTGTELKGGPQSQQIVFGKAPYAYPPQSYFRVGERHSEIDPEAVYGGLTDIIAQGTHCPLLPQFVLGYRYLVLLGTDSSMSFEPIHAPRNDAWYLAVRKVIEGN